MTTFFTVFEADDNKDVPAVAVFETVNDRAGAQRRADRLNRSAPGRYFVKPFKVSQ